MGNGQNMLCFAVGRACLHEKKMCVQSENIYVYSVVKICVHSVVKICVYLWLGVGVLSPCILFETDFINKIVLTKMFELPVCSKHCLTKNV